MDDERNSLAFAKDSDDTQPDATTDDHGPCWIRTSDHQIMSPVGGLQKRRSRRKKDGSQDDLRNRLRNSSQKAVSAAHSDDLQPMTIVGRFPLHLHDELERHLRRLERMTPNEISAFLRTSKQ